MIVSLLILLCPPLLVVITLRSIDWVSHFKIVFQFPYSSPAILALVALHYYLQGSTLGWELVDIREEDVALHRQHCAKARSAFLLE